MDDIVKKAIDKYENMSEELKQLFKEYYKVHPNDELFPEWFTVNDKDKIEMLSEAIKDNKNLVETNKFKEKYEEKIDTKK